MEVSNNEFRVLFDAGQPVNLVTYGKELAQRKAEANTVNPQVKVK